MDHVISLTSCMINVYSFKLLFSADNFAIKQLYFSVPLRTTTGICVPVVVLRTKNYHWYLLSSGRSWNRTQMGMFRPCIYTGPAGTVPNRTASSKWVHLQRQSHLEPFPERFCVNRWNGSKRERLGNDAAIHCLNTFRNCFTSVVFYTN